MQDRQGYTQFTISSPPTPPAVHHQAGGLAISLSNIPHTYQYNNAMMLTGGGCWSGDVPVPGVQEDRWVEAVESDQQ